MDASTILESLAQRGLVVSAEGDRLKVRGTLTDHDRQTIRRHKPELLEALRRRPVTLPESVLGIPIEDLRREGWDDWAEITTTPGLLEAFARSCIHTGTLKPRPVPFDDPDADLLGRPDSDWVTPYLGPSPADALAKMKGGE